MQHGHEELTPMAREVIPPGTNCTGVCTRSLYCSFRLGGDLRRPDVHVQEPVGKLLVEPATGLQTCPVGVGAAVRTFLEHAPTAASQALFSIVEADCRLKHHASPEVTPFMIAGILAGIREDYSHAWDTGWGGDENVYAILNEFFHYLAGASKILQAQSSPKHWSASLSPVRKMRFYGGGFLISPRSSQRSRNRFKMPPRPSRCSWRPIRNARCICSSKRCIRPSGPEQRERIENAIMALADG